MSSHMSIIGWSGIVALTLFCFTSFLSADWYEDKAFIPSYPHAIPGSNALVVDDSGEFISLYEKPALFAVHCLAGECVRKPIDSEFNSGRHLGNAYLFQQNGEVFGVYFAGPETVHQIQYGTSEWTTELLPLESECSELVSAAHNINVGISLLCKDDADNLAYHWQDVDDWQSETVDWFNPDWEVSPQMLAVTSDSEAHVAVNNGADILVYTRDGMDGWTSEIIPDTYSYGAPRIVADPEDRLYIVSQNSGWFPYYWKEGGEWQNWHFMGSMMDPSLHYIYNIGIDQEGELSCLFYWHWYRWPPSIHGYEISNGVDFCPVYGSYQPDEIGPSYTAQMAANDRSKAIVVGSNGGMYEPHTAHYRSESDQILFDEAVAFIENITVEAYSIETGIVPFIMGWNTFPGYSRMEVFSKRPVEWEQYLHYEHGQFNYFKPVLAIDEEGLHYLHTDDGFRLTSHYFSGTEQSEVLSSVSGTHGDIDATDGGLVLAYPTGNDEDDPVYFRRRPVGGPLGAEVLVSPQGQIVSVTQCEDGLARVLVNANGEITLFTEGTLFSSQVIDANGLEYSAVGLDCAPGNVLHIAYNKADSQDLIYGTYTEDQWSPVNLGDVGRFLELMIGPEAVPYMIINSTWYQYNEYIWHKIAGGWEPMSGNLGKVGFWSDGENMLYCHSKSTYYQCLSTLPMMGMEGDDDDDDTGDDDTGDDDTGDDDTGDDDTGDDDTGDDDTGDDDTGDDDTGDDDTGDDDTGDDDTGDDDTGDDDTGDDDTGDDDTGDDDDNDTGGDDDDDDDDDGCA